MQTIPCAALCCLHAVAAVLYCEIDTVLYNVSDVEEVDIRDTIKIYGSHEQSRPGCNSYK